MSAADDRPEPEVWIRGQVDEALERIPDARKMARKPLPGTVPASRSARGLGYGLLFVVTCAAVVFGVLALLIANATTADTPAPTPTVVSEVLDVDPSPVQP